ncbi:MAG: tetratricopeptide repeat protein [Flavobacteriales bacterium]|nr:tetratricopeptide repeat protein [Flavobacteriales bacterium]
MRLSIFIFSTFLSITIFANIDKEKTIDSLKNVISSEVHDTIKLKAYIDWDNLIFANDPKLDRELNFKITTICNENLSKELLAKEEYFYKQYLSKAYNNLALIFKSEGDLNLSLDYHTKSLILRQEIGDKKGEALSLMNIGAIFHIQGDLVNALKYYYDCLKIREDINDQKGKAGVLNNIGAIYHYQKDYMEAVEFYEASLQIRKELNDQLGVGTCYSNIGLVFFDQGDSLQSAGKIPEAHMKYDAALENYLESLKIYKEHEHLPGIGLIYNNIGGVYYKKGKVEIALDYYNLSREIKEQVGDKAGHASALSNMANIYFDKGQTDEAIKHAQKAYDFATEANSIVEINASSLILYKAYKKKNQPNLALKYHESYLSTKDSLQNSENNKLTLQQQFKYEYEKKSTADSIIQAEAIKIKNAEIAAQTAEMEKNDLELSRQKEQKYYLYGGLGLVVLFALFMANRVYVIKSQKKIIEDQKTEVETQKNKIELQHHQLEETHKEISDSIKYAQRLQTAILPEMAELNKELKNGFVLFKPKDVVSGDFYWMQPTDKGVLFAVADCTGHGVPGAMVSVVCSNALNRSVKEFNLTEPSDILNKTKELVIETFEGSSAEIKDGMDIALCRIQFTETGAHLVFAGANNPLWILREKGVDIEEIKGSKQPIGKYETDHPFEQYACTLGTGDSLYIFSDGYADQFGGEKGKKFKYKTLKDILVGMNQTPMDDQKLELLRIFDHWKGDFEQVDDVTLIGLRI